MIPLDEEHFLNPTIQSTYMKITTLIKTFFLLKNDVFLLTFITTLCREFWTFIRAFVVGFTCGTAWEETAVKNVKLFTLRENLRKWENSGIAASWFQRRIDYLMTIPWMENFYAPFKRYRFYWSNWRRSNSYN